MLGSSTCFCNPVFFTTHYYFSRKMYFHLNLPPLVVVVKRHLNSAQPNWSLNWFWFSYHWIVDCFHDEWIVKIIFNQNTFPAMSNTSIIILSHHHFHIHSIPLLWLQFGVSWEGGIFQGNRGAQLTQNIHTQNNQMFLLQIGNEINSFEMNQAVPV